MHRFLIVVLVLGGGIASADRAKPTLTAATPTVTGALDTKAVAAVLKRSHGKLLACYKKAITKSMALEGSASVSFTIGGDGKVSWISARGMTTEVDACIEHAIAKLQFAKPKDGDSGDVRYGLMFESGLQGGAFASLTGTGDISSGFDDTNIYGGLLGNEAGDMNGGFGRGAGPNIGVGTMGTIGHGSGTGSGYGIGSGRGGMRGKYKGPSVSIGQPNAQGDLDKAIIRRYIKRNIQKLTYCYEKELLTKPKLEGTVITSFTIAANGNVSSAKASGVDEVVASCVVSVIKAIEFPKPKGGGEVNVSYPFTFRPGDPPPKK